MAQFPTIDRLDQELAKLPEFQAADAFHQPDTPSEQRTAAAGEQLRFY
jgi:hypothetical protein